MKKENDKDLEALEALEALTEIEKYYGSKNFKKFKQARDNIINAVEKLEFEEAVAAWMNVSFQSLEYIFRSAETDNFTKHIFWKKFESCMNMALAEIKKIWINKSND